MRRSIPLWPTMMTLIGFAILISLGIWQLHRLAWKENLLSTLEWNQKLPVTPLGAVIDGSDSKESKIFRRVQAAGVFDYTHELQLLGRTVEGKVGVYIFTPLKLKDGRLIYVNRGWTVGTARAKLPEQVQVEGILREKMGRNLFTPANQYGKRTIYTLDPEEISLQLNLKSVIPFYIEATQIIPKVDHPALIPQTITLRNTHLLYAITWFTLAGCLLVVYLVYIFRLARIECVGKM